ncbi:MAG TPA: hypothetical protein PKM65_06495 [Spirochaetota bacterium]|nr:hypothetical protein [Spirochaetota bacterium]HNT09994.1 hypothetical protein [Spirochaetota bacterium]
MTWFLVIVGGLVAFLLIQLVMRWLDSPPMLTVADEPFKSLLSDVRTDNGAMRGTYRGHPTIVSFTYEKSRSYLFEVITTIVRMDIPPHITGPFSVSRETVLSNSKRLIGKGDYQTGDVRFDRTFLISSDHPVVLPALLNAAVRKNLLKLNSSAYALSLSNKQFMAELPRPSKFGKAIRNAFETMASIIDDIASPASIRDRLVSSILHDPVAAVRRNCLEALIANVPIDTFIRDVLEKAVKDLSIGVKIAAVRALKGQHLGELERVLKERTKLTDAERLELLSVLNDNRYDIPVRTLIALAAQTREMTVVKEILRSCAIPNSDKLYPFLMRYLDQRDAKANTEMIRHLGSVGTAETVEKLYLLGKKSINPFVRRAVQDAIAAIQARLGDVERGWLSTAVPAETEGALSIPDGPAAGVLSIAKESKPVRAARKTEKNV